MSALPSPPPPLRQNNPSSSILQKRSFALALLRDAASVLEFPISACCSSVYFYRSFVKQRGQRNYDDSGKKKKSTSSSSWSFELECAITTCLYLASKVEDSARRVSDVCNVVRRCRLRLQKEVLEELGCVVHDDAEEKKNAAAADANENEVIVVGESYYERKDVILELERDVLRALGFELNRTPQPHKYALALVKRRFGEEAKAATEVEAQLAESVDVILEGVLFGDDSDVDDEEEKVCDWEVKRVAVAAVALAEEKCGVKVKPNCAWEELLGGIDVMVKMREDVKVLKAACATYESLKL
jgi:hypothetical protein